MQRPSNGSPAMAATDSRRRSASRPPWMMPKSAWSGRCVRRRGSAPPSVRCAPSHRRPRHATEACGGTGWSRQTAMSAPSASWTAMACSGVKRELRAVEVRAEGHAVLVDAPQARPG